MRATIERLLGAWFDHDDYGVNAIAPTLPRTIFGTSDEDPAPPSVKIFTAADTKSVAKNLQPTSAPAFVLKALASSPTKMRGYRVAHDVVLAMFLMFDQKATDEVMNAVAPYLMMAADLSLQLYGSGQIATDYRSHNGITIAAVPTVVEHWQTESNGLYKTPAFFEIHLQAGHNLGVRRQEFAAALAET